jgi:hypothetical protein
MAKFKTPPNILAGLRHCPCCQGVFPPSDFNRDRQRPDGLRVYCKPCDRTKAMAVVKRRKDLLAAGKRMTNPTRVTPAERDRVNLAFLDAMTETQAARTARIAASVATRAALIASR